MIVKIKTRKKPSFEQLLNYMLQPKEHSHHHFILKHNIRGETIEEWVRQFKENETYRKFKRPDSVILSHEILSWHKDDTRNISLDKLEEMAREYISLRNPNGIYIVIPHTDKDHYHFHICASGVEYRTGKAMRMSKPEFTKLKQGIQSFQRQKFPELSKSIVAHGRMGKEFALPDTEYQIKRRTGRASDKEKILEMLRECHNTAVSKNDFFSRLQKRGLETYSRGGKITGIIYANRKYRFSRLGLNPEILQELSVEMKRRRELKILRGKGRGRELGR